MTRTADRPPPRFRVTRVAHLMLSPEDPRNEFDLSSTIAASLLGIAQPTLWRFRRYGRKRTDGTVVQLPALNPWGGITTKALFRLRDLETFAQFAYMQARTVRYELIPHWYAVKHHRNDLISGELVVPPPRKLDPRPAVNLLSDDEREAVDRGYPLGTYADGDNVYSLDGVCLTPGESDSLELHLLAEKTLKNLRETT